MGIEEHVHWGWQVIGIDLDMDPNKAHLVFEDGGKVRGKMVVGVEGSQSIVHQTLYPKTYDNKVLSVWFTGIAINLSPEEIAPLHSMDPLLFQGCHSETGTLFLFLMLETPFINRTAGAKDKHYHAQICMSWPVRSPDDEVLATDEEWLANMKQHT